MIANYYAAGWLSSMEEAMRISARDSNWEQDIDAVMELNEIVDIAISHGGDPGGAYYSLPDVMESVLNQWLANHNLEDKFTLFGDVIVPIGWKGKYIHVQEAVKEILENESKFS